MMGSFGRILRPVFDPGLAVAPPWWLVAGKTCVAAYQAKGAASLAASYINLANPGTYDAAPGVAPTWDAATGWTFNGTTQYLDTAVVPANGFSALARFSNRGNLGPMWGTADFDDGTRFGCAAESGNESWNVQTYLAGRAYQNWGYGQHLVAGTIAVAGQYGYVNGAVSGTEIPGWTAPATQPIWICRGGNGVWATQYGMYYIQAVAIYSATLTAGEVAAVSAAMAAL